ncbi:hypothetical protein JMUB7535_26860 [Staphylococcus aureus]
MSRGLGDVYKRQYHYPPLMHYYHKELTSVSYTNLRAHETCADLVCRLLLEKNV